MFDIVMKYALRKQPTFLYATTGWLPWEVMYEERAQKFHTGDVSLPRSDYF